MIAHSRRKWREEFTVGKGHGGRVGGVGGV